MARGHDEGVKGSMELEGTQNCCLFSATLKRRALLFIIYQRWPLAGRCLDTRGGCDSSHGSKGALASWQAIMTLPLYHVTAHGMQSFGAQDRLGREGVAADGQRGSINRFDSFLCPSPVPRVWSSVLTWIPVRAVGLEACNCSMTPGNRAQGHDNR